MYTFGELQEKVGTLVQQNTATYKAKIAVWLQLGHKLLYEIYDYWIETQGIHNFTLVDGQEDYSMPNNFDKPFRLYDITNDKKIKIITQEEYFDANIANIADANEGDPDYARIYGINGTRVAIASTGKTVQVKSSSASDTGGIKVRVRGYIDSSLLIEDYEDITISVASPTTYVAGTKTFYKIIHWAKSANTVGYVTLADSDSTVLDTLAPKERVARHKVLKLGLIPDNSTTSMRLLFKKTVPEMIDDNDYPFTECDRYLILDAWGWALKQDREDQRAEQAWKQAEEALKILLVNQNNALGPDYQHKIVSKWLKAHRL